MSILFTVGLLMSAGVFAFWLAWRCRLPLVPLILGMGALLRWLLPSQISWEALGPLVGAVISLVFFEGGRSLGGRPQALAGLTKKLVAIAPKVGWLLIGGLARLILQLPSVLSLLLGALLMIGAPYSVGALASQLGADEDIADVLHGETFMVACIACAWSVLMVFVIRADQEHPSMVQTLWLTSRVMALGFGMGYVTAAFLSYLLKPGVLPDSLKSPAAISLVLLSYSLAHTILEGSGLVCSVTLGYRVCKHHQVDPGDLSSGLEILLVGTLGVALAFVVPTDQLLLHWPARLAFCLALALVVRPLLVFLSTRGAAISARQRMVLHLVAPRGILTLAITAYIAHLLDLDHHPEAGQLTAIVYWVAIATNLLPWAVSALNRTLPPAGGPLGENEGEG